MTDKPVLYLRILAMWCLMVHVIPVNIDAQIIRLPEWEEPCGVESTKILLGTGNTDKSGWGEYSPNERFYFHEVLSTFFSETLVLDSLTGDRGIKWIFTGPREGFYIELEKTRLIFSRRYYDSFGYNLGKDEPSRYPQFEYGDTVMETDQPVKAITVKVDHQLQLRILLNGREVIRQLIIEDLRRQQVHLTGTEGILSARMLVPEKITGKLKVFPDSTCQRMIGWGGIGIPTAYHELSEKGKALWWQYLNEYNLLCQREYPVGRQLNPDMDNWDDISDAKAHYYGDNFPNGEISDFAYNRKIQDLGGFVMFEFWDFPRWIGDKEKEYARAIVGYCQEALNKTGQAPRIVGIQNEIDMPEERLKRFVPELRRSLDSSGFEQVKIHMGNASVVWAALRRAAKYTGNDEVWKCIDYAATNMYDYQTYFDDPDRFDSILLAWNHCTGSRPFISTELCINNNGYQTDSYRIAFTMGQLYEKNLRITNAVLVAYCWTILNVEQPTFGASRSLFVVSPEAGFIPVPSSNQLRVYGAFSRRIKEGMVRVETTCNVADVKTLAFKNDNHSATVVILNRSLYPVTLEIEWPGITFSEKEVVSSCSPNIVHQFSGDRITVEPGSIVTLTNVPLNQSKSYHHETTLVH